MASQTITSGVTPTLTTRSKRQGAWWRFLTRDTFWGSLLFYAVIGFFVINIVALVATVVIDSFAFSWFKTILPTQFVTHWYPDLSQDHDMGQLLLNTFVVALGATGIALLIGFPAAYVLARKEFRLKGLLMAVLMLPMLIPSLVYGIPLATMLIRMGLGGSLIGVILANIVPTTPFVILILTPFIEQVDTALESASRMLGAGRFRTFRRVLLPLVLPGMLTAGILAVVRTIALFELTYLVATTGESQTLVTALYGDATGAGIRAHQLISAMAVVYMLTTMSLVIVALFFVKPTQFVVRLKAK
ncbi:MAG TPA: ABC transporter permease subunit [Aggregatilineales bacterium]|nr:ABC transporter permease subunit [Aggregatilineales bacterium]